jgi:hypothetical protein
MNGALELPTELPAAHALINELFLKNQALAQRVAWF